MYISNRLALTRNITIATVNSTITLIILLIAPLGLAAVIANTVLIGGASFIVGMAFDFVIAWLSYNAPPYQINQDHKPPIFMLRKNIKNLLKNPRNDQ